MAPLSPPKYILETNPPSSFPVRTRQNLIDNRELKKRLKNREKEAKKAEKAANAPAPAESAAKKTKEISAAEEEENLNPNVSIFICRFLCGPRQFDM